LEIAETMKFARAPRRLVGRTVRRWRDDAASQAPHWLAGRLDQALDTLDMHVVDHGMFRMIYSNTHKLSDKAWRSSQPTPGGIRAMAERGVKTVVNLRGERNCGAYRLETKACKAAGLNLVSFIVRSRDAPEAAAVIAAKALFAEVQYPILIHCKSGADRVGLMSALYLIFSEGVAVEEARKQLHWRFGHFRQSDTGILDAFFDSYVAANNEKPIDFIEWVRTVYDRDALKRDFKAGTVGNLLVNTVLRRE
jgi:protein tyrosine/serine phosphatase